VTALTTAVRRVSTVNRIIDLRTQHIGPEELLVAAKIEFDRSLTNPQISDAVDEVEGVLRRAVPLEMQIYLEPDLFDSDYLDSTAPVSGDHAPGTHPSSEGKDV
jgi:divalent metal cation (Fe/Co/Zn/Cd) transporter